MIEIISLSGLLLSSFMGYIFNFFDFKEIYCSAYGALLLFMIFGRCFITISSNQMIPEKKRLKIEIFFFFLATTCLILLCLYNTKVFSEYNKIFIITIYAISLFVFISVKSHTLYKNHYGKKYVFWQMFDIVLIFFCTKCNLILKTKELTYSIAIEIIFLILLDAAINEHIVGKLRYWTYLRLFKESVLQLILSKREKKLTYPPEKDLIKDPIFSKCAIILNDSSIRVLDCYMLARIVRKILIENGFSFREAHYISSKFLGVLSNNLMRRSLDNKLLPSKIINFIYNKKRNFTH